MTYVVNGNGGTPLRYVGEREWTLISKRVFGYTVVDVHGQRLELRGKTIDGDVIDTLEIDKSDETAYEKYVKAALAFESIDDREETADLLDRAEDLWEEAEEAEETGGDGNTSVAYVRALDMLEKAYELDATCAECVVAMGFVNNPSRPPQPSGREAKRLQRPSFYWKRLADLTSDFRLRLCHCSLPIIISNNAFCACKRFSAWSKTTELADSITESVTSSPREAGKQCMNKAPGLARAISSPVT